MAGVLVFDRRKAATHTGIYGRGSAGMLYTRGRSTKSIGRSERSFHLDVGSSMRAADNGTKEWGRGVEKISESTLVGPYGTCFSC
jgi:hypothetical protein